MGARIARWTRQRFEAWLATQRCDRELPRVAAHLAEAANVTTSTCNVIGCRAAILETEVFCARCLSTVQSHTRRILGRSFRPGKKYQSAVFLDTLTRAMQEALYFKTNGHPIPRDRAFEWDDVPC